MKKTCPPGSTRIPFHCPDKIADELRQESQRLGMTVQDTVLVSIAGHLGIVLESDHPFVKAQNEMMRRKAEAAARAGYDPEKAFDEFQADLQEAGRGRRPGHTRMTLELPDEIASFARHWAAELTKEAKDKGEGLDVSEFITMTLAMVWGIQLEGDKQFLKISNAFNEAFRQGGKRKKGH